MFGPSISLTTGMACCRLTNGHGTSALWPSAEEEGPQNGSRRPSASGWTPSSRGAPLLKRQVLVIHQPNGGHSTTPADATAALESVVQ